MAHPNGEAHRILAVGLHTGHSLMAEPNLYIWISRWEEFQHYKPDRDRPPAWIKSYTKQLSDARYLELTDRQRALLHDLRHVFAVTGRRLGRDVAAIARHRHRQTFRSDLESLNHAGFIEFISREALEKRLEKLYSTSPLEVEREREVKKNPLTPSDEGDSKPSRAKGTNPRAKTKRTKVYKAAESMVKNVGVLYDDDAYLEELARFELTDQQRSDLNQLRGELMGGTPIQNGNGNHHEEPPEIPAGLFLDSEPDTHDLIANTLPDVDLPAELQPQETT
jgi:hypothetical protein